jgi:hypothetical protein
VNVLPISLHLLAITPITSDSIVISYVLEIQNDRTHSCGSHTSRFSSKDMYGHIALMSVGVVEYNVISSMNEATYNYTDLAMPKDHWQSVISTHSSWSISAMFAAQPMPIDR